MPRTRPGLLIYQHMSGTEEYIQLLQPTTTFGRAETCDIVIPRSTVSRVHARIELQHNRYILSDAGSSNGTFVNGQPIEAHYQLSTDDEIWLGSRDVALIFSDPEETVDVTLHSSPPPLFIDPGARIVRVHGITAQLTTLEYDLLLYLASNPRRVCSREECFAAVWGQPYDHTTCEDALNACMARLRRNLRATAVSAGREPPQLTTIKRIGFRLDSDVVFAEQNESLPALKEREVGRPVRLTP
jgi:DNA-binding winged helix-turn-helix (wHTH) protein